MKEIEVINYYDENGAKMVIPLSPLKTPSENAQVYFTKYTKLKNS
ncbi:NFACT family protein, partial [Pseudomonas otitidis]